MEREAAMKRDNRRFQSRCGVRGSGVYTCGRCGKRTRETGDGESSNELCRACLRICYWENHHSDECHDDKINFEDCQQCNADGYNEAYVKGKP